MRALGVRILEDERGSALALVAVSLAAVTAMLALAIDLGMLYTARAEAQRAADSAALAGASAYLDASGAPDSIKHRAKVFGHDNYIRNLSIDTALISRTTLLDSTKEEVVQVIPATSRVRVSIQRQAIPLWFARLLGRSSATVSAWAVAEAAPADTVNCVAPLALPDVWNERTPGQDGNNNRTWDTSETWTFDPTTDYYARWSGGTSTTETGYGSAWRNGYASNGQTYVGDQGRQLIIKPQNPNNNVVPNPGWFFPIQIGNSNGGNDYRNNFWGCPHGGAKLGVPISMEMGNMVGPTKQAIDSLVKTDPTASWNMSTGTITGSKYPGTTSPRVIKIALFDPHQLATIQSNWKAPGAPHTVTLNNIAVMFLEGMQGTAATSPVVARFMYYAPGGSASGGTPGTLVKTLRLVK